MKWWHGVVVGLAIVLGSLLISVLVGIGRVMAADTPYVTVTEGGAFDSYIQTDLCVKRMEAAMRAMDPYVVPQESSESFDGCNHCGANSCTLLACAYDASTELRRLEWEVGRATQQVARARQQREARKVWATVKHQCWGDR